MKTEWTGFGFVGYSPLAIDDVDPIGPAGKGNFGPVVHKIQEGWNFKMQIPDTATRELLALLDRARRCKNHALPDIRLHLPNVAGMSFLDIDHVERYTVPVLFVDAIERGSLPAKGRSGIAAEDQYNRPHPSLGRERDRGPAIEAGQVKIGRHVARLE